LAAGWIATLSPSKNSMNITLKVGPSGQGSSRKKSASSGGCSVSMVYSPPRGKSRKKMSLITFRPRQESIKVLTTVSMIL